VVAAEGGVAVVTVAFTPVFAVVVSVVLAVVAGDKEVAGDIDDLDEISCTGLTVEGVKTVVEVVVVVMVVEAAVVMAVAVVEVVMGAAVVVDDREVTVVAELLGVDVLDACKVVEVRAIGVMVEGFVEVSVVTAV